MFFKDFQGVFKANSLDTGPKIPGLGGGRRDPRLNCLGGIFKKAPVQLPVEPGKAPREVYQPI